MYAKHWSFGTRIQRTVFPETSSNKVDNKSSEILITALDNGFLEFLSTYRPLRYMTFDKDYSHPSASAKKR